jgi:hypothetical protein
MEVAEQQDDEAGEAEACSEGEDGVGGPLAPSERGMRDVQAARPLPHHLCPILGTVRVREADIQSNRAPAPSAGTQ